MNQRHFWTIVALSLTVMGTPSVGRTQTTKLNTPAAPKAAAGDVVKVGELKTSTGGNTSDAVNTSIHPHKVGGRRAATLYIRNIPVITFLSSKPIASTEKKVGVIGANDQGVQLYALNTENSFQVASLGNIANAKIPTGSLQDDPVHKAGLIAAKINQMIRNNVKADQISVSWKGQGEARVANPSQNKGVSVQQQPGDRYTIKINNQELVEINQNTRLADTTNDLAKDALQATNRLRRLIGNASPLTEIANLPSRSRSSQPVANLPQQIASNIRLSFQGIASFYGRGFHGRPTATGERFNSEAMTAAHRSLPFGTRVRVTNTRNGRSVVVRINDRGPYIRGRVIDLSTGAARMIGMIGSGVAPVKIEVLGR
ncbi:septal ring lytic transglycosylase RlpA family protein [Nostoc sp. UHCC 0870]|uniref:septal ring lytic transglycosylase RlpA family protein n=1 Tax=Nostoc sp. UHCC 0870 TaxID=2914041 RepID=UPI001EDFADA8|nr:septal ring lytic transglycosylase RlpA family protein [Nostoc sp. UHCC 0870]UKP00050.1 septal ring lytic transglycosylase RlpA family protein [Nostoc sp. UHCC 0870]